MLAQLASRHDAIGGMGWDIIGVAPQSPGQASTLLANGHPFDLYLDEPRRLYVTLHATPQTLANYLFNLPAWGRYIRALVRNRRQGRITGHHSNVPAVFLTSSDGTITRRWIGRSIADYPPLDEIEAALRPG